MEKGQDLDSQTASEALIFIKIYSQKSNIRILNAKLLKFGEYSFAGAAPGSKEVNNYKLISFVTFCELVH